MSIKNIIIISFVFFPVLSFANYQSHVIYQKPVDQEQINIQKNLKDAGVIESVSDFINEKFILSKPLTILLGGDEGPLYDPSINKIFIPYYFIEEVQMRFKQANYNETGITADEATMDSLMHTLFHELAHALIFNYELPVLGKEEDAADSLASVLLIEYFNGGAEILISAADLFDLERDDADDLDESSFWGVHSLNAQRYYSSLCHVYGSDPETYSYIKTSIGLSEERADVCEYEYSALVNSWLEILDPYLTNEQ